MKLEERGNNVREKCSSMIAPHFEILFEEINKLSTRYGIILPFEFWLATTFTLYTASIHFFGYSDVELVFFGSFTLLVLLYSNSGLISIFIKKIRDMPSETTLFLSDLENKNTKEVQKFLRDNRNLKTDEILLLLKSKFGLIPSVHESISKYQSITGEILEYIANNFTENELDPALISQYIFAARDDVSNDTINKLLSEYDSREVKKSLFVNFPLHFQNILLFSALTKFRIAVQNWLNYGSGNGFIALPAFIISMWTCILYYTNLWNTTVNHDAILLVIGLINAFMGFFIIFGIIFIIIKIFILIPLWLFKKCLFIIAPQAKSSAYGR